MPSKVEVMFMCPAEWTVWRPVALWPFECDKKLFATASAGFEISIVSIDGIPTFPTIILSWANDTLFTAAKDPAVYVYPWLLYWETVVSVPLLRSLKAIVSGDPVEGANVEFYNTTVIPISYSNINLCSDLGNSLNLTIINYSNWCYIFKIKYYYLF